VVKLDGDAAVQKVSFFDNVSVRKDKDEGSEVRSAQTSMVRVEGATRSVELGQLCLRPIRQVCIDNLVFVNAESRITSCHLLQ